MDTDRRADANYHANGFAISVETCDHFRGLTYTNPPLSPGQVQAWIKLGLWAAEVHGIPRRRVPEWDSSGFGYHSMFGAPSHYTPAAGKTCPNPTRIRQFNEQVLPAIVAGKEGDWFSMADVNDLKAAVRAVLNDESIATEPKAGSIASKIKDIQADGDQTRLDLSKTGDRIGADILRRVSNSDEIQADLAILAANVSELQAAVAAIKAMLVGPPA
jgi:hypothetical protein